MNEENEDEEYMRDAHTTLLSLKSDSTAPDPKPAEPKQEEEEEGKEEGEEEMEDEEEEGREWKVGVWGADEDARLQEALRKVLGDSNQQYHKRPRGRKIRIDWPLVSELMGGTRSPKQCYGRYWNSGLDRGRGSKEDMKAQRRLGPWSAEEDRILLEEVKRQQRAAVVGTSAEGKEDLSSCLSYISWAQASDALDGLRTRKQCMVRFKTVLQFTGSTVKVSGSWTVSEDRILVEGVRLYRGQGRKGGVAWAKVSEHMGHTRTMKQCKKRWDDAFDLAPDST